MNIVNPLDVSNKIDAIAADVKDAIIGKNAGAITIIVPPEDGGNVRVQAMNASVHDTVNAIAALLRYVAGETAKEEGVREDMHMMVDKIFGHDATAAADFNKQIVNPDNPDERAAAVEKAPQQFSDNVADSMDRLHVQLQRNATHGTSGLVLIDLTEDKTNVVSLACSQGSTVHAAVAMVNKAMDDMKSPEQVQSLFEDVTGVFARSAASYGYAS